MLGYLFRCIACDDARPAVRTFPLCLNCMEALAPCPPLCPSCASPFCVQNDSGDCLRPWARHGSIRSFRARYLLINPGYRTLRRWKARGGIAFERKVLNPDFQVTIPGNAWIVPIPQRFVRAWRFGGSPSERIAKWISRRSGAPVVALLEPVHDPGLPRQAELSAEARLQNRLRFRIRAGRILPPRTPVVLVDDFMTTGHTLRKASDLLAENGADDVHVFCLGVRPVRSEQRRNLLHRECRPESVGQE